MKQILIILLISTLLAFISCNSNAPTEEVVVKKDTTQVTVVAVDTVARKALFKMSARIAVLDSTKEWWTVTQADYKIDSIISRKADAAIGIRLQTLTKNLNYALNEVNRLDEVNALFVDTIQVLKDSLRKIHPVVFPDDSVIVGQQIDTVYRKKS